MKLVLVRHLWGVDLSNGYGSHCGHWRKMGYTAIEASFRFVPDGAMLKKMLREEGFSWIPQIFSNLQGSGGTVRRHLDGLREQMEECLDAGPLFFNGQLGSDHWTLNEAEDFFGAVIEMEREIAVPVYCETHRSRYLSNPWNTARLLDRLPALKLTCDFSHWVCVAERLLEDAAETIARASAQCHHVHARVGYAEGPQVPDPRDRAWALQLQAHERWWEMVWAAARARGDSTVTLTPEFGPPPYLHTLPYSGEPVSNLEEICDWMAERQAAHFTRWLSEQNA